jgi:hypothetical protein
MCVFKKILKSVSLQYYYKDIYYIDSYMGKGALLNSFAFNYRSHETKIVLFCVHAKWILAV